jgi:hypothetical protein
VAAAKKNKRVSAAEFLLKAWLLDSCDVAHAVAAAAQCKQLGARSKVSRLDPQEQQPKAVAKKALSPPSTNESPGAYLHFRYCAIKAACKYLHDGVELRHRDLLGPLDGHGHLRLVLKGGGLIDRRGRRRRGRHPYLAGQEREDLPDDGVQALADLRLLVHLHVEAVRHLVVLEGEREEEGELANCIHLKSSSSAFEDLTTQRVKGRRRVVSELSRAFCDS